MKHSIDYLIIGAGPAGLQLGYYLEQNQRDYLILERADHPGAFFSVFPRHRMLISINKPCTGKGDPEINLPWDWNSLLCDAPELRFTRYSERYFPHPDDLIRYLDDFARHYQLNIAYNTHVERISRRDGRFVVADQNGQLYTSKRLIVATGVSAPYIPDIPGIDWVDQYATHSLDRELYRDRRVLIIGKGNSAFETAEHLTEVAAVIHICSPHSVTFAHYYTVTLAYGHFRGDPFSIERDPAPEKAAEAAYLHPIIRRFDHERLVSEHHIQDDLENEWYLPEYVEPARAYFRAQWTPSPMMEPAVG